MPKPRVYEIAKDLNQSSKEIINELAKYGVEIKNHMGTLEPSDMDLIFTMYLKRYDDGRSIEEVFGEINADRLRAEEEKQAQKIIRTAARMARAFNGNFTALFVETPSFSTMSEENREQQHCNYSQHNSNRSYIFYFGILCNIF